MHVGQGRELETVNESILARIRSHVEGDASNIGPDTPISDLGIHSLELTEIIFDIEEEFDIEVEMSTAEAWEHLTTVRDIIAAVQTLVAAKT